MAEHYRFMDAVQLPDGSYDQEYNAQDFTDYFKALVTTGVMKGAGNQLAVSTNGSSMITRVNTGIAFLLGRYYENDSLLELTHDTETLGNSRIDRIVIRMDLNTNARYVRAFIKKGVPSANPIAPTLTQTANLYEISLAQVRIVGGQTFIATDAVTDERGTDVICPWAGSNILPNFNDDSLLELINRVNGIDLSDIGINDLNNVTEPGIYYYNDPTIANRPSGIFPAIGGVYLGDILVVNSNPYGTLCQTIYRVGNGANRYVDVKMRGYYGGVWGEWFSQITSQNIATSYVALYVDGNNGLDTNNGTSQTTALKTVNEAIRRGATFLSNRLDIFVKGPYFYNETIQIYHKIGSRVTVQKIGNDAVELGYVNIYNTDRIILEGFTMRTSIVIENCPDFHIKNVISTGQQSNNGITVISSRGIVSDSTFSSKVGTDISGIFASENSSVLLKNVTGTGSSIGILSDGSIIRKGTGTTITGTTAQKLLNGGQIV